MKWSPKKHIKYHCTGSGTNENFSIITGTNVVQTIGIFKILKCGGEVASVIVPEKLELEYLCTGSSSNKNFSVLTGTNEVQMIGIFEILICRDGGQ